MCVFLLMFYSLIYKMEFCSMQIMNFMTFVLSIITLELESH